MKIYWKFIIGIVAGGAAGSAYYHFVGCSSGNCPITSNWVLTTLFGGLAGAIVGYPKPKKHSDEQE